MKDERPNASASIKEQPPESKKPAPPPSPQRHKWLAWLMIIVVVAVAGWVAYSTWHDTVAGYERAIAAQQKEISSLRAKLKECEDKAATLAQENKKCRTLADLVVRRGALRDRLSRLEKIVASLRQGSKENSLVSLKEGLFAISDMLKWEKDHAEDGFETYLYSLLRQRVKSRIDALGAVGTEDATAMARELDATARVVSRLKQGLPFITVE